MIAFVICFGGKLGKAMKNTGCREKEREESRMTSKSWSSNGKKKKLRLVRMTLNPTSLEQIRRATCMSNLVEGPRFRVVS